jgi:hypothetical protein
VVLFTELLYTGELIIKTSVAAVVAAIQDDPENLRYGMLHNLIRADGIGEWSKALDEAIVGPASQNFNPTLIETRRVLNDRLPKGSWQHDSTRLIHEVICDIKGENKSLPDKVTHRAWFSLFIELRNKTRGHGATTPAAASRNAPKIEESLKLITENSPIFDLPWAYLHRNLSGKYRVIPLGGECDVFSDLKSASAIDGKSYRNGVYIWAGRPTYVDLVHSDLDATDFYVPNGNFSNDSLSYELISPITDLRLRGDARPYSLPAGNRPKSETEGHGDFIVLNEIFTNAPANIQDYVTRPEVEAKILEVVQNDRHPIITLVGRGGIGKTSLVLAALSALSKTDRFDLAIWFSARDIDLTETGAKPVQPRVLTEIDISKQYLKLISGLMQVDSSDAKNPTSVMATHLRANPLGKALYIFDNFETLQSPVDLFNWIDMNIRLPNKAIITSRFRDFKADYPIEVQGMEEAESLNLIKRVAVKHGVSDIIQSAQAVEIFNASNGHPYIMKIVVGQIADVKKYSKPAKLIARKDDILDALFERTFGNLSPAAARIFLTLCGWRSPVPRLALEAVLLRHGTEMLDFEANIDQLIRMSMIEASEDVAGYDVLDVPLSAALFGKRKLHVASARGIIEADTKLLQQIGAVTLTGARASIRPQIEMFFRRISSKVNDKSLSFDEIVPILEFLARGFPSAWILLSELATELDIPDAEVRSSDYLRRYIELNPDGDLAGEAWSKLVLHYKTTGDAVAALAAFLQQSSISQPPVSQISEMANLINNSSEMKSLLDIAERHDLLRPLIAMLEANIKNLSPTDLSRLSWLYLHSGNVTRAEELAQQGVGLDPENTHCRRILFRLKGEL